MAAISQAGAAVGILSKDGPLMRTAAVGDTTAIAVRIVNWGRPIRVPADANSSPRSVAGCVCVRWSGVVLAAEKRITSKLLDIRKSTEKMYKVDEHVACAVAGITADANILINYARQSAQRYYYAYQVAILIKASARKKWKAG